MTSVSLFASATRFPFSSAASVASRPAAPTIALSTMSTSSRVAAATSASVPLCHASSASALDSTIPTNEGENLRACSLRRALLLLAVSAATRKRLRCLSSTRSAVVPMEPVEPRTATPFGPVADPGVIAGRAAAGGPAAETRSASRTAGCRTDRVFRHVREGSASCPSRQPPA